jgi:hypothetical protein
MADTNSEMMGNPITSISKTVFDVLSPSVQMCACAYANSVLFLTHSRPYAGLDCQDCCCFLPERMARPPSC